MNIIRLMHQRPTLVATVVMLAVLLPVWWLSGDFSPLP